MSVQTVSGTNTAWQMLAEMRAARAAAVAPATDEAPGSAWASATQGSSASGGVTGAAPAPPPPPGVLQFFQQLQSVDSSAPGTNSAAGGPPGTSSTGTDTSQVFADLQSMLASLQQGGTGQASGTAASGSAQSAGTSTGGDSTATTVTTNGSADPSGATQTGNDLALQWLGGLQGGAWQLGAAQFAV
jgi:hypothetical protein